MQHPVRSLIDITGAALAVAGTAVLITQAALKASSWHVVSFSIYGTSLVAVWVVSSVYHSLPVRHRVWKKIDHAMIYFLIAGTYTPICLVILRGGWGWTLFGINWTLAIAGMILKLVFAEPPRWAVVVLFFFYIIMGWLVVIAWGPLVRVMPAGGIFWLVSGGVFYTLGAAVLNIKFFNFGPLFGAHEIWHLFVLAGSFSHYWLMLRYVSAI